MKILKILRSLLPQRGAKVIPAVEMKLRIKDMEERIALSKNKKKDNDNGKSKI